MTLCADRGRSSQDHTGIQISVQFIRQTGEVEVNQLLTLKTLIFEVSSAVSANEDLRGPLPDFHFHEPDAHVSRPLVIFHYCKMAQDAAFQYR